MLTEDWISLAVVVLCLALSFFFSASETALTGFSRARMLQLEKNGNARARLVNRLVETRERMIGAILAGNNVANIAASALTTGVLLRLVRRCRRALRNRHHDGRDRGVHRGVAEDDRDQCARSRCAHGGAPESCGWCG